MWPLRKRRNSAPTPVVARTGLSADVLAAARAGIQQRIAELDRLIESARDEQRRHLREWNDHEDWAREARRQGSNRAQEALTLTKEREALATSLRSLV
jgi:chromosome segregation ATPase